MAVLPVLEILFRMPAPGPREGTQQWLKLLQSNPHLITYEKMVQYPPLMRTHVKGQQKFGDEFGLCMLLPL